MQSIPIGMSRNGHIIEVGAVFKTNISGPTHVIYKMLNK